MIENKFIQKESLSDFWRRVKKTAKKLSEKKNKQKNKEGIKL